MPFPQKIDSPEKASLYLSMMSPEARQLLFDGWRIKFEKRIAIEAKRGKIPAGPLVEHLNVIVRAGLGRWV